MLRRATNRLLDDVTQADEALAAQLTVDVFCRSKSRRRTGLGENPSDLQDYLGNIDVGGGQLGDYAFKIKDYENLLYPPDDDETKAEETKGLRYGIPLWAWGLIVFGLMILSVIGYGLHSHYDWWSYLRSKETQHSARNGEVESDLPPTSTNLQLTTTEDKKMSEIHETPNALPPNFNPPTVLHLSRSSSIRLRDKLSQRELRKSSKNLKEDACSRSSSSDASSDERTSIVSVVQRVASIEPEASQNNPPPPLRIPTVNVPAPIARSQSRTPRPKPTSMSSSRPIAKCRSVMKDVPTSTKSPKDVNSPCNIAIKPSALKAKRYIFLKNGDEKFPGFVYMVSGRTTRTLANLLGDLTKFLERREGYNAYGIGIRYLFTPLGNRISSLAEFGSSKVYVFSDKPKFIPLPYLQIAEEFSRRAQEATSGLSVNDNPSQTTQHPAGHSVSKPLRHNHLMDRPGADGGSDSKVMFIVRNGYVRPREVITLAFTRRSFLNLRDMLAHISRRVQSSSGGPATKLFNLRGLQMSSLEDVLKSPEEIFIAVGEELANTFKTAFNLVPKEVLVVEKIACLATGVVPKRRGGSGGREVDLLVEGAKQRILADICGHKHLNPAPESNKQRQRRRPSRAVDRSQTSFRSELGNSPEPNSSSISDFTSLYRRGSVSEAAVCFRAPEVTQNLSRNGNRSAASREASSRDACSCRSRFEGGSTVAPRSSFDSSECEFDQLDRSDYSYEASRYRHFMLTTSESHSEDETDGTVTDLDGARTPRNEDGTPWNSRSSTNQRASRRQSTFLSPPTRLRATTTPPSACSNSLRKKTVHKPTSHIDLRQWEPVHPVRMVLDFK
ncbi:unnamed protein product [Cyprideis torosa]|uniref:Uncharacterized protein n=1 Tax=Cyprideis torosa TaxID=163714 RepID=A0A7R8W091_9CRUS|nr:unnamed protein product [Cyprideis torosa]CAG0879306.1 unnamed protein product [Cyprideis torosa]